MVVGAGGAKSAFRGVYMKVDHEPVRIFGIRGALLLTSHFGEWARVGPPMILAPPLPNVILTMERID